MSEGIAGACQCSNIAELGAFASIAIWVELRSMKPTTYGFARFDNLRTYSQSRPDTPVQEAIELLAKLAGENNFSFQTPIRPPSVPPIMDWPRITDCIRRGALFSLTIEHPGQRAFLRFNPSSPLEGDYEIRIPSQHRNETGNIVNVTTVDYNGLCDHRHSMLFPFPIRYVVTTCAADRQRTQQVWRIGISTVREINDDEMELNPE